jgi:hypothetical protein
MLYGPRGANLFDEIQREQGTLGYSNTQMQSYHLPLGNEQRTLIILSA